jgi:hypothetical protein
MQRPIHRWDPAAGWHADWSYDVDDDTSPAGAERPRHGCRELAAPCVFTVARALAAMRAPK